jgi:hypothetical protein
MKTQTVVPNRRFLLLRHHGTYTIKVSRLWMYSLYFQHGLVDLTYESISFCALRALRIVRSRH